MCEFRYEAQFKKGHEPVSNGKKIMKLMMTLSIPLIFRQKIEMTFPEKHNRKIWAIYKVTRMTPRGHIEVNKPMFDSTGYFKEKSAVLIMLERVTPSSETPKKAVGGRMQQPKRASQSTARSSQAA